MARRRLQIEHTWNWWPINRPHLQWVNDFDMIGAWVSWGNGNSDPVWTFGFTWWKHRL